MEVVEVIVGIFLATAAFGAGGTGYGAACASWVYSLSGFSCLCVFMGVMDAIISFRDPETEGVINLR